MALILDIESNGLWPEVTKIHCAVIRDTVTDTVVQFIPDEYFSNSTQITPVGVPVKCGLKYLTEWLKRYAADDVLSCHNGIGFDLKLLKRFYDYEHEGEYLDTLLASRILWPDIEAVAGVKAGPYSIDAWGNRFGVEKPKHEDWSEYSEEMLHRCTEDTKIQAQLYRHIQKHIYDISANDKRVDFSMVFRLEHKVWKLIEEQSDNGWQFDLEKAYKLCDELQIRIEQIDSELLPHLPKRVLRPTEVVTKAFKADGGLTKNAELWVMGQIKEVFKREDCPLNMYQYKNVHSKVSDIIGGDFSKVQIILMNLNSDTQMKEYLLDNGWQPKEYNFKKDKFNKPIKDKYGRVEKTSPKLPKTAEDWEELERTLNIPNVSYIAERNKASHRLSQIKGLINAVRPDHRIEAKAITSGTNTRRMKHSVVVNIPKAKESVYYGTQMRSLFIASPGRVLVGCDAHALEARIEAHYIYPFDPDSAMELIEGDIHTRNAGLFGVSRDLAKNGKYAIGYGCAPAKLAETISCNVDKAKQLIDVYWDGNPGLKHLKELLENSWEQRRYILSIDKCPLTVRYKHALINTLFQSAGSIVMKVALCILNSKILNEGLDAKFVGNFHDEWACDVLPKHSERVARLSEQAIAEAGRYFNLNVPLIGEAKIGDSWADIH